MSRSDMLRAVRSRLGVQASDATRAQAVSARLLTHATNTRPAVGQLEGQARLQQFIDSATGKGAKVLQVSDMTHAVAAILEQVSEHEKLSPTEAARSMGVTLPDERLSEWAPKTSHDNCVSTCFCAIAESGSLVVTSHSENSLAQNFLADRHFVLLPATDILDSMESVWQKVRASGGLPRDLTLVSGPSSTGDIEMRMEKGAHGPKELIIVVLSES